MVLGIPAKRNVHVQKSYVELSDARAKQHDRLSCLHLAVLVSIPQAIYGYVAVLASLTSHGQAAWLFFFFFAIALHTES